MTHSKQLLNKNSNSSTLFLIKNELSLRFLIVLLVTTSLYLLLQIYLFNYRLINTTLFSDYPLLYQITLLYQLIKGFWIGFPLKEILFTNAVALLVGINTAFLLSSLSKIRIIPGKKRMSFGGVGVLALASSGCPSCGITLLSFLGPATGPLTLFLHNIFIQGIVLSLLVFSVLMNIQSLKNAEVCEITR